MMDVRKKIADDFVTRTQGDYVGLWTLPWMVRHYTGESNQELVREIAFGILSDLLRAQLIVAGNFTSDSQFVTWVGSADLTLAEIEKQWLQLGREPDIGEIVWFKSP